MGPGLTVAVDIGGTKALLRAEDATGAVVHEQRLATGRDTTPGQLDDVVDGFLHEVGAPRALVIACPGLVATEGARVVVSDVLPRIEGWRPRALARHPGARLVNDVRAALYGAQQAHPHVDDLAVVVAGTGIAAGFTSSGQVHRGAEGWAGELGSVPVRAGGEVGTLDSVASGAAILSRLGASADEVRALLSRRDEEAQAAVQGAGRALGEALATVLNLLNPGLLVLAGGALAFPGYGEAALSAARRWTLPELWGSGAVTVDSDPGTLVLRGVMAVARDATPPFRGAGS
jgi:glucokinase